MTALDPTAPLTEMPGPPVVTADPDSELGQLTALYDRLDVQAKAKTAELEDVKTRIKAELAAQHPDTEEILLVSSACSTPLRMYLQTSWRLDSKRLKAANPHVWVQFAKEQSTWYLARVK